MPSLPGDLLLVSEFIDFMISAKDVSSSEMLKSLLDIFFLLGILLRNPVLQLWKLSPVQSFSFFFFF